MGSPIELPISFRLQFKNAPRQRRVHNYTFGDKEIPKRLLLCFFNRTIPNEFPRLLRFSAKK